MSTPTMAEVREALPDRIVVGANGAYWRDYGSHYSMCVVSDDNDPVEVIAVYVRDTAIDDGMTILPTAEVERLRAALDVLVHAGHHWQLCMSVMHGPSVECDCGWGGAVAQALTALDAPKDPGASS